MSDLESKSADQISLSRAPLRNQMPSREASLLFSLARLGIDLATEARIQHLAEQNIDWQLFKCLVEKHRLVPLVFRHLSDRLDGHAPIKLVAEWGEASRDIALRNVVLANELVRLLEQLRLHGIQAIPYKGPVLAAWIYGDLSLRTIIDLDLIVRERELSRVKALLLAQDYRVYGEGSIASPFAEDSSHLLFARDALAMTLEIHWTLAPSSFPLSLRGNRLWTGLVKRPFGRSEVLAHSPQDLLLILAIHAGKHHWSRLAWIVDIAELARQHPEIRWDGLVRDATRYRCRRILLVGLWLACSLLDVPVPDDPVRFEWAKDPIVPVIGAQVMAEIANPDTKELNTWAFQWSIRECFRDRIESTIRLVAMPTEADREYLQLPAILNWLYPILRAFRLISKYTWKRAYRITRSQGSSG